MNKTTDEGYIEGVFSIERLAKIGTGTTTRRTKQMATYYARQLDETTVELQGLNNKNVPSGHVEEITIDDLLNDYLPMPQLYNEVISNIRKVQKAVARGDKFRKRNETFTAEYEYANALNLDEQNVRANFGIGLCLLARGEKERAQKVFDRIINLDSAFADEHKHLFNEYGIALRKNKLIGQAIDYYKRAIEISSDDENLWFNLARAQYERQNWKGCSDAVIKCLALNPDHPEGKQMLTFLTKKGLV